MFITVGFCTAKIFIGCGLMAGCEGIWLGRDRNSAYVQEGKKEFSCMHFYHV